MAHKETILITGANGFIGGWLAETLHLRNSTHVRAGIRSWSSAARLARFPIEITLCDVMDKEQIARAMYGVTCVIHCATGSSEVIIQGTKNMLEVAQKRRIGRFVHLSTAEVYGDRCGRIDESCPYQYTGRPYGDSKIEAEKLCWEHNETGLAVTVIRPSIVYGPFSKDWTVRFAANLQSGNWGIFKGIGEGICNLIYVSDLVSGILLAARHEAAVGEAFNIVGPESISWNQYFQRFNTALGLPELQIIQSPKTRLRAIIMEHARSSAKFVMSHFADPLKKISQRFGYARELMKSAERTIRTTPRPSELSLFDRDALYLTTKAEEVLGFRPRFDVETGLGLTVRWLDQVGLVDYGA